MRLFEFTEPKQILKENPALAIGIPAGVGAAELLALGLGFATIAAMQAAYREDPDVFKDAYGAAAAGFVNLYNSAEEMLVGDPDRFQRQQQEFSDRLAAQSAEAIRQYYEQSPEETEQSINDIQAYLNSIAEQPSGEMAATDAATLDTVAPEIEDVVPSVEAPELSQSTQDIIAQVNREADAAAAEIARRSAEIRAEVDSEAAARAELERAANDIDSVTATAATGPIADTVDDRIDRTVPSALPSQDDIGIDDIPSVSATAPSVQQPEITVTAPEITLPDAGTDSGAIAVSRTADTEIDGRTAPRLATPSVDAAPDVNITIPDELGKDLVGAEPDEVVGQNDVDLGLDSGQRAQPAAGSQGTGAVSPGRDVVAPPVAIPGTIPGTRAGGTTVAPPRATTFNPDGTVAGTGQLARPDRRTPSSRPKRRIRGRGGDGEIKPFTPLQFTPIQISDPMDLKRWERFN